MPAKPQRIRLAGSSNSSLHRIANTLTMWFERAGRDLPWRRTRDPYAIWVSEIMLQQTQVRTVIPYWNTWMRRLPTVRDAARARPDTLLKLWEGLGYYRRVRNLHQAAKILVRHHGGRFPTRFHEVLALPGIGRYTAGAICSIAYNQPVPILDGNVIRVLCRLFGIEGDPAARTVNSTLWALAESLVTAAFNAQSSRDPDRDRSRKVLDACPSPGTGDASCSRLNQALMELGALICQPRAPQCGRCPVRASCVARRTDRVEALPSSRRTERSLQRHSIAVVLQHQNRFLVCQRPSSGINGRLWEFPCAEGDRPPVEVIDALLKPLRKTWKDLAPLTVVRHAITRYRIRLECRCGRVQWRRDLALDGSHLWLPLEELLRLPFTGAHRKILSRLVAGHH